MTFHWYGFFIGLAAGLGVFLVEAQAKKNQIEEKTFWQAVMWIAVFGVIGARLYHVLTDYQRYEPQILDVFKVWQGGMSIIGAVIGGAFGGWLYALRQKTDRRKLFLTMLDLSVFGLPIAHAIGRVGNYLNQELYGLPTNLPWGIPIDVAHRIPGYTQFSHFHPLFAYEMVGLLCFGAWVWWRERHSDWRIGSGHLFATYLLFYSGFRFILDFLRIDKATFSFVHLGVNQCVMLGVFVGALFFLSRHFFKKYARLASVILVGACAAFSLSACQVQDHQIISIKLPSGQVKKVEIVNTPASMEQGLSDRDQIGSDGMLFLFTQKTQPSFWMVRMKFDLDLIWLDDNVIKEIHRHVPRPTSEQEKNTRLLPTYSPKIPVNAVLEVPAGTVEEWGLKVGDRIELVEASR